MLVCGGLIQNSVLLKAYQFVYVFAYNKANELKNILKFNLELT